jgi:hypothetical protein
MLDNKPSILVEGFPLFMLFILAPSVVVHLHEVSAVER